MVRTVCAFSPEVCRRNHDAAARRGYPWLAAHPERNKPLAIVGGGHSARAALEEILAFPGDIMAINGAYDWLQGHGRVADWVMVNDPDPIMATIHKNLVPGTKWLVASMCHASLFDQLEGQDVTLFFAPQGDEPWRHGDVPGGSSAMTRAPVVAAYLGYRDLPLYGADCCYLEPASHVYGGRIPDDLFRIEANGREWMTDIRLYAQAEYLAEMIPVMEPGVRVRLVGDHLAQAMLSDFMEKQHAAA